MAEYFPSIRRWLAPLCMATLFFGPISYWGFVTHDREKIIMACITATLLIGMYCLAVFRVRHPVVSVDGNTIRVRGLFFRTRSINDLREYKLVVSEDFIAFRKASEKDVMINKTDFSSPRWDILKNDLKSLPFADII